ncbi:DUF2169 family type VI secretion system accessory protein [Azorhizobium doebereinerae]|uniref:DUF2169 family type VI secretion system accessory protein n=1 Tax=Azorhizobium doebereinerae TaxID=281091 RepID=UPI0004236EC5|nr:DUF2169 domain-containing protein [Azorhizobium doebereinerae]
MPLVIKPRTLAVLTKVERRTGGARYIATVMAAFDLADSRRLDGEQALWLMAAQALPPGGALDTGMPKPRAELLIGGRVQAPDRGGLMLEAQVAGLTKRLAVFGDRWWAAGPNGYAATAPQPLTDLLLGPELAFGGPGHRLNPGGRGFGAAGRIGGGQAVALPNVEDPAALLHRPEDEPAPALFGPLDVMHPERARLAGTYDQAWVEHVAPALANDIHPDFFMTAPPDQRFGDYLAGGEPYRLRNFSAAHPELSGHLPALRPRAFVGRGAAWVEMTLRLDTLWLFAGARRGLLAWHGVVPVADLEGRDVTDLMLAYEHQSDPPRPLDHYARVRRLRTDPATAPRHAFSDGELSPAPDPAEAARRADARRTQAARGAARRAEASDFLINRRLDALAVPAAVRPPPAVPDPDPLLLPTPEDLADGDFDLGAVLDALEAKTRAAHDSLLAQAGQGQAVLGAMDALKRPGAGADAVDALLASLAPLGGPDVAGALDAAAPAAGPGPELDGAPLPPALDAALAAAGAAGDWRALLADALQGTDDAAQVDAQVAAARARFLALPEASPFAPARAAMATARAIDLPPLPPRPEDAPAATPPPPADPLAGLLANLAAGPDLPPETAAAVAGQMAAADRRLGAALPALAVAPGRSALDTLLADLAPADPATDPAAADPQARMAQARHDMAAVDGVLDAAAPRLAAGLAALRLNAPQAAYPQEAMSPHVARSFGDIVLAEARAGLDLRGRDLAGANLAGADLSGLDLTGAFLEKANLANARLAGAILVEAALSEARLDHTDLTGADLTGANLCGVDAPAVRLAGARLDGTRLIRARMPGAMLRGAMLRGVQALEVVLDGADLSEARLDEVLVLKGALAGAVLAQARLRQCLFLQADMTGVDASGAFLDRCALTAVQARGFKAPQADLRGSTFIGGTLLAEADFSGALASDCSFFGADLTGARFPHAVLDRAVFGEAKLAGADFRLASLRRAFLDAAVLPDADFIGAQMMEAQLHRADLARATLRGANLFGADLSDADLAGADLTGANLFNTVLALETTHA